MDGAPVFSNREGQPVYYKISNLSTYLIGSKDIGMGLRFPLTPPKREIGLERVLMRVFARPQGYC